MEAVDVSGLNIKIAKTRKVNERERKEKRVDEKENISRKVDKNDKKITTKRIVEKLDSIEKMEGNCNGEDAAKNLKN